MSRAALQTYAAAARQLYHESGLSEPEFRHLYHTALGLAPAPAPSLVRRRAPAALALLALLALLASWRGVAGALQEYLHPGLRLLRILSLPLLALFPALNELYDETCLIQNPFFRVVDMDCWPCSSADSVLETGFPEKLLHQQYSAPFVYKTDQQVLNLSILEEMYIENKDVFDRDAYTVTANYKKSSSPTEMFDAFSKDEHRLTHKYFLWRINRISPAQIIRKLIPRPKIVPRFGQSTERFLIIDLSSNSFQLPDPECNFVFLLQIKGDRLVQLQPAQECVGQCKSLTVLLKESYLLWYNWWYWRPIMQSAVRNETSIAHMGSFC